MARGPYSLTIDGVGPPLRVHSLRGREAISQLWHFDVVVTSSIADELERVALGSRATLIFDLEGKRRAFYGVVAAVRLDEVHAVDREMKYSVRVVPRLWLLRRSTHTRIFQSMRVPDIVTAVLGACGIATRWALMRPYPLREYCTQYEETDYDFVRRLLAESGIYFYFFGGGPVEQGVLDANMALAIGGSAAGAVVDVLGGGGAAGAMVDATVLLAQTLVPGDTVVGADDAIAYPGVAADDPAALAASTVASMTAGVLGAIGVGSSATEVAAGAAAAAVAGAAIGAATQGSCLAIHYSENAAATASAYDKVFHFRLRNTVRSHGAQFRDYDPDKPGVRLQSAAVSAAPFAPTPLEIAAAAAAAAQNAANAVEAIAAEASAEVAELVDKVADVAALAQGLALPRELYEHHSPFLFPKWAFASEEAPLMLRQARRRASIAAGEGGNHDFSPGHRFELRGHAAGQLDAGYVVTTVHHRGEWTTGEGDRRRTYFNTFECAPASMAYPPKRPKRRSVQVALTATVVGPKNTEVHVDERGRVKVQFHWDREGKLDGNSSCWIRAMQAWAGPAWGHQFIPRVGMEVVVVFEGGDPDKPMVLGSLYNATHPPSFALPENKTKSGIRTQSSPGGGGFNELSFEDSAGREEIFLRGQRDYREEIGNDRKTSVGANLEETIGNNRATLVGADLEEHVKGDHFIRVDGGHFDDVRGQRTSSVRGAYNVKVREQMSIVVGEKGRPGTGELHTFGDTIIAGTSTAFVRSDNLVRLVCGDSYLEITPDTIRLSADNIVLDGKKMTSLKGKGPGMKLGESAEITAKDIRIVSEKASLILDKEAKLDGAPIRLNCRGMAPNPAGLADKVKSKKVLLQLTDEDSRVLAGKEYVLMAAGTKTEGTTDGEGNLDVDVPDAAKTADLTVYLDARPEGRRLQYRIKLDTLPAADTVSGVKARLRNLGYYWGAIDDDLDGFAQQAIREFELDYGLDQTGKVRDELVSKLVEISKQ